MKQPAYQTEPNVFKKLAGILGVEIKDGRLEIPAQFGRGFCAGYVFNDHIRMLILDYQLNEELLVNNPDVDETAKVILFKFQNIFPKTGEALNSQSPIIPSVLIATSRMNTDAVISLQSNPSSINIEVDANYLAGLFDLSKKSPVLQGLLQNTQPLLFEQIIYPSLQKIVDEIMTETIDPAFKLFFLRVKAEELICRLLIELEKRDEKHLYALNPRDVTAVYKVKERILLHLETSPAMKELTGFAGMSSSKLKRVFKQVFGDSIFNYYQQFRIREAARLLREERLSVSEAGYRLGFTNLSHFSRIFNKQIGMKPKQYSRQY